MNQKRNHKIIEKITLQHIERSTFSLKTASTDLIGTNKKPDVLRVLRCLGFIDYSPTGKEHIILGPGLRYLVSDKLRRKSDSNLFQYSYPVDSWDENFGSEIYITGRNALELKRDHFDNLIMMLLEPPKIARRNGLKVDALINTSINTEDDETIDIQNMNQEDEEFSFLFDSNDNSYKEEIKDKWVDIASRMAASGNESGARALVYLSRPRTMALINELGKRVGIDLKGEARNNHLFRFCSFRMRELLKTNAIFLFQETQEDYLDAVAEMTTESYLGFNPYAVSSVN